MLEIPPTILYLLILIFVPLSPVAKTPMASKGCARSFRFLWPGVGLPTGSYIETMNGQVKGSYEHINEVQNNSGGSQTRESLP